MQKNRKSILICSIAAAILLLAAVIIMTVFGSKSGRNRTDEDNPPVPDNSPFAIEIEYDVPEDKNEPASVHDAAFYLARWQMIQKESADSGLDLKRVEKFVADAGAKAPAEAVKALAELRTVEKQNRALVLRNELLDQALAFDPEETGKLNLNSIKSLYQAVRSKYNELKKLDAGLSEHVFLPEHRKIIDAYVKELSDLQSAVSSGGGISSGTKPGIAEMEQMETEASKTETEDDTESSMDSRLVTKYLFLLDFLPGAIRDEQKSAEALRLVNDLLSDKDFDDESPRRNCLGIRKFLVLNNAPLLPYLDENEKALRGMKLFPRSYPDSALVDISGSTFRLKVQDDKANITQRKTWNQLRREEGEDRIVVTLINSPQLAKLSGEFREYLFVRALFLGVDPEDLRNRFAHASGLSDEKMEELSRIAGLFRKPLLDEED